MDFYERTAGILNQLDFQVNGKQLDAHNVAVIFTAVRVAMNQARVAAREGSAVAGLFGPADPIPVSPAIVGAPVDPAARTKAETAIAMAQAGFLTPTEATTRVRRILGLPPAPDCGFSHQPGATCHHTTRAPDWWPNLDGRPSPNLEPDAWADGGRPDVALADPQVEPVSSPPGPWPEPPESPSEPPTPTEPRAKGVSAGSVALSPVSDPVPPVADPDRYPDPLLEPSLWDAAVARGDDPDADLWPDPATFEAVREDSRRQVERAFEVEPALLGSAPGDPYWPDHPYHADWPLPGPLSEPSPRLLKRRRQTAEGVAVPALYPHGYEAGKVIDIPIPDLIPPEPDWLDPSTRLPGHWLTEARTPEHAAVGHNPFSVARPLPDPCGLCEHGERCDCPPPEPPEPDGSDPDRGDHVVYGPPVEPESAWAYPNPEGE